MSDRARSAQAAPVGEPEFAALMRNFAPFETRPVVALAVSGGRDSRALALLARTWVARRRGRAVALVVDHGLRAESAAEAGQTVAWLRAHAIEARILRWRPDPPPHAGIQAAARQARYRLLFDWCRRQGVLHLLTAHQADDQVETHVLRAVRDSGPTGLAAMSALVEFPEARLLRPLLPVSRARLTATLEARGEPWIDDPSNADTRFARARLRRDSPPALSPAIGARLARLARNRVNEDAAMATAIARCCTPHPLGAVRIEHVDWLQLAPAQAQLVLAAAIAMVSGADYPPRRERTLLAAQRMRAAAAPPDRVPAGLTLGGCRILWRGKGWQVVREPASISAGRQDVHGVSGRWDGRFLLASGSGGNELPSPASVIVAGSGGPDREAWQRAWPATAGLPAILAALPGFEDRSGPGPMVVEGAVGAARDVRDSRGRGPVMCFRPVRPLAPGPFFPCFAPAKGQIVNR